jgi:hypothetical protein
MGARRVCWDVWGGLPLDRVTLKIELFTSQAGRETDAAFNDFVLAVQHLDDTLLKELLSDGSGSEQSYANAIQLIELSGKKIANAVTALQNALDRLEAPESQGSFSVAREKFFSQINYEALFAELCERGAILEDRVFWDVPQQRSQEQAGKGGLLLLEETTSGVGNALGNMHDQLVQFQPAVAQGTLGTTVRTREFDLVALIPGLTAQWTRLEWYGVYVTLIFKEASRLLLQAAGS